MIRKLLVAAAGVVALAACTPAAEDKAETTEGAMAPAAEGAMAPAAEGAMAPAAEGAMAADDKMAPAQ
jgi:hypothetical protein